MLTCSYWDIYRGMNMCRGRLATVFTYGLKQYKIQTQTHTYILCIHLCTSKE